MTSATNELRRVTESLDDDGTQRELRRKAESSHDNRAKRCRYPLPDGRARVGELRREAESSDDERD